MKNILVLSFVSMAIILNLLSCKKNYEFHIAQPSGEFGDLGPYPDYFLIKTEAFTYCIVNNDNNFPKNCNTLKLNQKLIRSAKYFTNNKLVVIVYEAGGPDDTSSYITSIDIKNKKTIWEVNFNGFNVGMPLVKDEFVYITSIGYIGKLNILNGEKIWEHNLEYEQNSSLSGYNKPIIVDDVVIFKGEYSQINPGKNIKTIEVDDKSGKIIKK